MKQIFVIDTKPLIALLLFMCANSEKENKTTEHCKKQFEKHFPSLQFPIQSFKSEKEKERARKYIHKYIITYMINNIIVTPHILTETHDLLTSRYDMKDERKGERRRKEFWMSVMDFIKKINEECVKKEDIINEKMFVEYGFADTSVYFIARELKNENKEYILITDDEGLIDILSKKGLYMNKKGFCCVHTLENFLWSLINKKEKENYFKS